MVVLTNTCLAVLPALIFTEMVDYCSVFLLSQKIYDIVMVVFDLVNALVNRLGFVVGFLLNRDMESSTEIVLHLVSELVDFGVVARGLLLLANISHS